MILYTARAEIHWWMWSNILVLYLRPPKSGEVDFGSEEKLQIYLKQKKNSKKLKVMNLLFVYFEPSQARDLLYDSLLLPQIPAAFAKGDKIRYLVSVHLGEKWKVNEAMCTTDMCQSLPCCNWNLQPYCMEPFPNEEKGFYGLSMQAKVTRLVNDILWIPPTQVSCWLSRSCSLLHMLVFL